MSLTDQHIIEQWILSRLAGHPAGDRPAETRPGRIHATRFHALCAAGYARLDPATGLGHLTQAGWYRVSAARQERLWEQAATEHAMRQGPVDAHSLRRLAAEYSSTELAYRRLVALGAAETAAVVMAEADLLRARLAVICEVAVEDMAEVAVLLRAEELAMRLDAQTAADHGRVASVDPRQRLAAAGLPVPGDPWRYPWRSNLPDLAGALLIS